jgi:hypothetical protein
MRFIRFILILLVLNTLLFTGAKLANIPIWMVIAGEAVACAILIAWKAWFSSAQQLANQARLMGWEYREIESDVNGYRDTLFERRGVVARISFQEKCIFIVNPEESGPYKDFIELERALAKS